MSAEKAHSSSSTQAGTVMQQQTDILSLQETSEWIDFNAAFQKDLDVAAGVSQTLLGFSSLSQSTTAVWGYCGSKLNQLKQT